MTDDFNQSNLDSLNIFSDPAKCKRCGNCQRVCPALVFSIKDALVTLNNTQRCIGCGHCVCACKTNALTHSEFSNDEFLDIGDLKISSNITHLFKARRSVRNYKKSPLEKEEIIQILNSCQYSPTASNVQDMYFKIITKKKDKEKFIRLVADYYFKMEQKLKNPISGFSIGAVVGFKTAAAYKKRLVSILKMLEKTLEGDDRLFYNAPCIVIVNSGGLTNLAMANCNLAAMQIILAAEALGYGTCLNGYAQTALIKDKDVKNKMGIKSEYTPGAVIAIGKPDIKFYKIPPRKKRDLIFG